MATTGTVLFDFMSQNATIILVTGVLATFIALTAYYIARVYLPSNTSESASVIPEMQDKNPNNPRANSASSDAERVSGARTSTDQQIDGWLSTEEEIPGTIQKCLPVMDSALSKKSGDKEKQATIDPVYYCEHIQGEIKKVKQGVATRKICENLSAEQIAEERKRQQDQLAEIFKLMQQQEEKFGISSMEEMHEQMRLYADLK